MKASGATRRSEPDQRLLVLLAVGLALCLAPLLPRALFSSKEEQPVTPPVYLWLTGARVPKGLYRLAPDTWQAEAACSGLGDLLLSTDVRSEAARRPAAFRLRAGEPPIPSESPAGLAPFFFAPIAINQADRELLTTLPGIGPRLADGIIALRQQKKKIKKLDELFEVTGIGKGKIAKLKGLISFE